MTATVAVEDFVVTGEEHRQIGVGHPFSGEFLARFDQIGIPCSGDGSIPVRLGKRPLLLR